MPAYSGSLYFNISTIVENCNAGDQITFELTSDNYPASNNWTASMDYGSLTIDILPTTVAGYPFATSSVSYGNFISGTISPNIIVFNSNVSSFLNNYQQVPYFTSASVNVSSSLYIQYEDINSAFSLNYGDKIILKSDQGKSQILTVNSYYISNSKIYLIVDPNLDQYFINYPNRIITFLLVKKMQDEQNIIMTFNKPPGETSYGFVIPEDINLDVLNSISSIQSNVQQQLLSTQQNSQ